MEIAFFPVPDMKTELNCAPQVSAADEFSSLLSSMLKTAQTGAPLETGLIDTASVASVPTDGVKETPLEASPESEEAVEVKEDGEEAVAEALLNVVPNESGVIAAPAELPAEVPLMNPAVQGRFEYSIAVQGTLTPQNAPVTGGVNNREVPPEKSSEKANASISEKGRMDLAATLSQGQPLQEHFEIEIPAEEILKQSIVPVAEPAIAASGEKAEAKPEKAAVSAAFEQEPVGSEAGKAEKASADQVRGQQADVSGFAFQESEGQGQNYSDAFNGQHVQEAQAGKPENILNNLSFEKILDAPVKETSASPARFAPLAAEVQEKVQAGIKVSVEQGGGEVKMKLNPESLGEVRIKLNVADGNVRAEITVENPEVKRIIESDSAFLRDSLGAHGLTLDKCVVEVSKSFEAGNREKNGESLYGDEKRPMKDRDEKENRQNSGWHQRHFSKNHTRHEDGGVDFFI